MSSEHLSPTQLDKALKGSARQKLDALRQLPAGSRVMDQDKHIHERIRPDEQDLSKWPRGAVWRYVCSKEPSYDPRKNEALVTHRQSSRDLALEGRLSLVRFGPEEAEITTRYRKWKLGPKKYLPRKEEE